MIGQIRCFIPGIRRGTIQTDNGDCVSFCVLDESANLRGGDIVEFEPTNRHSPVSRVVLRNRWSDKLTFRVPTVAEPVLCNDPNPLPRLSLITERENTH